MEIERTRERSLRRQFEYIVHNVKVCFVLNTSLMIEIFGRNWNDVVIELIHQIITKDQSVHNVIEVMLELFHSIEILHLNAVIPLIRK